MSVGDERESKCFLWGTVERRPDLLKIGSCTVSILISCWAGSGIRDRFCRYGRRSVLLGKYDGHAR